MQLAGEIPTTKDEQSAIDLTSYFSSDLVDMEILGTMGGGMGGGGQMPANGQIPGGDRQMPADGEMPTGDKQMPTDGEMPTGDRQMPADGEMPGGGQMKGGNASKEDVDSSQKLSVQSIITISISFGAIVLALIFTFFFKRKKFRA